MRGAGDDIWDTSDQFHFVSQPLSGNIDIRVRVSAIEPVASWTKAGLMIRSALTAGASHAFVLASPGKGVAFQRRTATNGLSTHTSGGSGTAPVWLRLVRQSSTFIAYRSSGSSWTEIGRETISMPTTVYVGLAVSSHVTGLAAAASFTDLAVSGTSASGDTGGSTGGGTGGTGLPAPWISGDVGSPAARGRASVSNGTFSVSGAGRDIWDASDQFHFLYQRVSGDTEIVARVTGLTDVHSWSKAGVMIRESLNANARHASMFGSVGRGWAFQRRLAAGGTSYSTAGPSSAPPGWVRLVREGNLFSAYYSTNGSNWTLVESDNIPMGTTVYVGLAVTSHYPDMLATGTFTNVAVDAPSGGNRAPSVSISSPSNGTTYNAPASMTVSAAASDTDGTVARVDFYRGSTLIGSDTSSPFGVNWSNVPAGTYSLTAVATDNGGETATSPAVNVTVNGTTNQPPSVTLTGPAANSTFTAPASITLTATAGDSDGSVARVDFYRGSTLIGSDTSAPYSFGWSNVPEGGYSLTAVARDNAGATRTSSAVSITVNSPTNQVPAVSITSPSSGATFAPGASITVSANASDADGTIAEVAFYRGSTLIGTDTSAPYSATWTNATAGNHALTAVARDNRGATRTSGAVNIVVAAGEPRPAMLAFVPSPDHVNVVTSYTLLIFRSTDQPTGTPRATRNLGKPSVLNGEIVIDVSATIDPLPAGSYYAVVRAIGSGGSTNSSPSATFSK